MTYLRTLLGTVLLASLGGCGVWVGNPTKPSPGGGSPTPVAVVGADLPLVTPQVRAAAPASFRGGSSLALALPVADFKSRFFSDGPTDVYQLLSSIDDRITGINTQTSQMAFGCVTASPAALTVTTFGEDVPFFAQCYEPVDVPPPDAQGFLQWAKAGGVTYLFYSIGATRAAIVETPVAGSTTAFLVEAWLSVGANSGTSWDNGSYGVIHLKADPSTNAFEMTVAGTGFGYCGAQMRSDGTNVYAKGSLDGPGCAAVDSLCVKASDGTSAGACSAIETFALEPLGRQTVKGSKQTYEASKYPPSPTVVLDGTSSDMVHFGPSAPSPGAQPLSN